MAASQSSRKKTTTGKTTANRKTTAKKTSSGRKTTARKSTARNSKAATKKVSSGIRDEILIIIALAVSVLMVLSNFDLCGKMGEWIAWFVFGMFGWIAYIVPFIIFFGTAFYISNKDNRIAKFKMIAAFILTISLMTLIQMVVYGYSVNSKLTDYFKISAQAQNGGGIIGGSICHGLGPLFGTAGTYVIIVVLMLIGLILLTEKSIFKPLGRAGKEFYSRASEEHQIKKQAREEEREARMAAREEELAKSERFQKLEPDYNVTVTVPETPKVAPPDPDTAELPPFEETTVLNKEDFDITVTHMEPIRLDGIDDTQALNQKTEVIDFEKINAEISKESFDQQAFQENLMQDPVMDEIEGAFEPLPDPELSDPEVIALQNQQTQVLKPAKSGSKNNEPAIPVTDEEMAPPVKEYVFPPIEILKPGPRAKSGASVDHHLKETAIKLQSTLESFGVRVQVTNVSCGPSVTRYELQPEQGVKVSRIVSLADDIKLNLAVADIRIEAPIPGKAAVGIEVPNKENTTVMLRDLLESKEFQKHDSRIAFAAGRDIGGQVIVADIAKMPHLLIAGSTGSGKSVCINTLIMSIIYKAKPEDVRVIMVDPKVVELSVYNGIPHLLIPVVTDPKKAAGALNWAVAEMDDRYKKFAELNVRDLKGYNEKIAKNVRDGYESEDYQKLPQIVIIVDELADLMMVAPGEVEDSICRLAQLARAAGIHLVIATQRPSVNVITGLIKANVPSRIAFSVSSGVDSRTIIDMHGAEKLLGKGDMLFYPAGYQKPQRVQGAFVSDKEVNDVVEFLKAQGMAEQYSSEIESKIVSPKAADTPEAGSDRDVYFVEAGRFIIEKDKASIGMLQRVLKIGFNRAARIMDQLYEAGVVGPEEGTKPRKIEMTAEEFERFVEESV